MRFEPYIYRGLWRIRDATANELLPSRFYCSTARGPAAKRAEELSKLRPEQVRNDARKFGAIIKIK